MKGKNMGLLSGVTKALGAVFPTSGLSGVSSKSSGGLGSIGGLLNDITGTTSAGKVNQKYAKELAEINQKYALESMKKQYEYERTAALNAHQWEIKDLEKAGLNPILSYGGTGASADVGLTSGGGSPGSMQPASANPLDIFNSITSANKMKNENDLLQAQKIRTLKDAELLEPKAQAEIKKMESEKTLNEEKVRTEQKTQDSLFFKGMSDEQQAVATRIQNQINQIELDTLQKYGVTRKEIVDIGKKAVSELLGLIKAGKYAKAANLIKRR